MSTTSNTLGARGTIHGSMIFVSFKGTAATSGTVSGGSVVLNFPQPGGTLAPITCRQRNARRPTVLQSAFSAPSIRKTNLQAQANQAQQLRIDSQIQSVESDLSSLNTGGLSKSVGSVHDALQQEAQALATTQTAKQKVLAAAPNGDQSQTCYNATSSMRPPLALGTRSLHSLAASSRCATTYRRCRRIFPSFYLMDPTCRITCCQMRRARANSTRHLSQ